MGQTEGVWLDTAGAPERISPGEAAARAKATAPILCHAPAVARRLGCDPFPAFDLLELFAFVRPAAFCVPTPLGLAQALGLAPPHDLAECAQVLGTTTERLLEECTARLGEHDPQAVQVAWAMARTGWRWGPAVLRALGRPQGPEAGERRSPGLDVWGGLEDWEEPHRRRHHVSDVRCQTEKYVASG